MDNTNKKSTTLSGIGIEWQNGDSTSSPLGLVLTSYNNAESIVLNLHPRDLHELAEEFLKEAEAFRIWKICLDAKRAASEDEEVDGE